MKADEAQAALDAAVEGHGERNYRRVIAELKGEPEIPQACSAEEGRWRQIAKDFHRLACEATDLFKEQVRRYGDLMADYKAQVALTAKYRALYEALKARTDKAE